MNFKRSNLVMSSFTTAMVCTTCSGLATAIGGIVVYLFGEPDYKKLGKMLSFSAGVMIYVSFVDILEGAINSIGFSIPNIAFFIGMILFVVLEKLIPEPDLSRFFPKPKTETDEQQQIRKEREDILMLGIKTAFSICLHNFPEGIAVYMACLHGVESGLPLMLVIAGHNIPEGLAVAAPVYSSTGSKWEAFKWALISGVCEPFGALTVGALFYPFLTPSAIEICLCGVSGIMVFMSIVELIPSSLKYISPESSAQYFSFGMAFMAFGLYFMRLYSL
ncbi:permease family protein [Entamoeba histolytica HM-1:IMSS-B]|uniref:Zinc transporter, putative n=5 Tax=Entamoeba histolytica TaxID=5759 RepID=C4LVL2_ENTH1|nr:zinc transporter, putative [Entamoeba histolytica HM-1:IMSS]EAL43669.1 zinc transporter, putative [Entamoeba histolytica HM-1:IMSS]EMH76622.1 permease family protein [Entamoeba histolytica HM-1:IMSS-B]ENY60551.1 zinc transporter, putative [Entamoeba histolytica HM-1:IMSS-A]GAT92709.1 metal cation transporter zinc zn2 -iron fe2 permease [Entamoeba histolytica]|eukprot:XP_649056.1 zinc transporter, putative [Entamoeba histolytica HM-1:IMSS]